MVGGGFDLFLYDKRIKDWLSLDPSEKNQTSISVEYVWGYDSHFTPISETNLLKST